MYVKLSHVHIEFFSLCEMYSYYAENGGLNNSSSQITYLKNTTINSDNIWNFLNINPNAPSFSSSSSLSRMINVGGTNLKISFELARYMCKDVCSVLQPVIRRTCSFIMVDV